MSRYLTPAEFAERIHLPDEIRDRELWVKRRCRSREITHVRPSRNIFLIDAREVERYLAEHRVERETGPEPEVAPDDSVVSALRTRRKKLAS